jgi:hypothetical protein
MSMQEKGSPAERSHIQMRKVPSHQAMPRDMRILRRLCTAPMRQRRQNLPFRSRVIRRIPFTIMPHLGQRARFWAGYSPFQLVSLVRVVGVRGVFCGRGIDENTIVIIVVGVVRWEDFRVLAFNTWGVWTMG